MTTLTATAFRDIWKDVGGEVGAIWVQCWFWRRRSGRYGGVCGEDGYGSLIDPHTPFRLHEKIQDTRFDDDFFPPLDGLKPTPQLATFFF